MPRARAHEPADAVRGSANAGGRDGRSAISDAGSAIAPSGLRGEWDDLVLVGTIARPHGLRGEVVVNAETDFVEERFRTGASFLTQLPDRRGTLVVRSARVQNGRPVIAFDGFDSVEDAERLAGLELRIPEGILQPLPKGAYYHHQLAGCSVVMPDGVALGRVERVEEGAGGALLVVERADGDVLIPLAEDICVGIDVDAKRIEIAPPEGLIELNVTKRPRR